MTENVWQRLIALCLAATACGGDDDGAADPNAGQQAGTEQAATTEHFALLAGSDTVLTERFSLAGDRLEGEMRHPSGARVEYSATYGGAERVMTMTYHRPDSAAAAPPITTTFTLRGDSATLRREPGGMAERSTAVPAGTLPYLSPSVGMLAFVARAARESGGDSAQVSLLAAAVGQTPIHTTPTVVWRGDTARVVGTATSSFDLVFSEGRLVEAVNGPQQMRAVRLR